MITTSQFSTYTNGLLPSKYLDNANQLFAEVTDKTIHLDLIDVKKANGTVYDHTIFGNMGSRNENIFYFKNKTKPTIIV